MKLRMLVVVALGCLAMPVIARAQAKDTTNKAPKDTMAMPAKDTTSPPAKDTTSPPATEATNPRAASDSITRDAGAGPQTAGCPLGCPTSKGAAGLTGVQFLALQQELRDRKCGTSHVTGVLDAPTRRAIRNCAKRYGVANSAAAVLAAMNVGYTAAELGAAPNG